MATYLGDGPKGLQQVDSVVRHFCALGQIPQSAPNNDTLYENMFKQNLC